MKFFDMMAQQPSLDVDHRVLLGLMIFVVVSYVGAPVARAALELIRRKRRG